MNYMAAVNLGCLVSPHIPPNPPPPAISGHSIFPSGQGMGMWPRLDLICHSFFGHSDCCRMALWPVQVQSLSFRLRNGCWTRDRLIHSLGVRRSEIECVWPHEGSLSTVGKGEANVQGEAELTETDSVSHTHSQSIITHILTCTSMGTHWRLWILLNLKLDPPCISQLNELNSLIPVKWVA